MIKYKKNRFQMTVGQLLRKKRHDAGLSQLLLGKKLKEPQSFISKYEMGKRILNLNELEQICEALDIKLVSFVKRLEVNKRK